MAVGNYQRVTLKIVAISAFAVARPANRAIERVSTAFHEVPSDLDKAMSSVHAALAPTTDD